ncbi:MAG: UPF0149 family protein [Gammaproteobacteria bacterium]|nr:UPF0149 family protein [Gammaproteobacteria bacterium]
MIESTFIHLEDTLCEASAAMGAAECDGALYGSLISAGEASRESWLTEVLGDGGYQHAGTERCWRLLEESWQAAAELIESESFSFVPLLPKDNEPLSARTRALGEWCGGFLFGLGIGGVDEFHHFSQEAQEVIGDLSEITRIESTPGGDEAAEAAFAELTEYVRVGVQILLEEIRSMHPAPLRPTLH